MSAYISELESEGYTSLRTQYYREQALRPARNTDMSDAAMIDNTDLMMDKDKETEEEPKDTDETMKKDPQVKYTQKDKEEETDNETKDTDETKMKDTQVGETQKDNPKETQDSPLDKEDTDQETVGLKVNDKSTSNDTLPPPKTHLETLLATKVTPPLDNPPNIARKTSLSATSSLQPPSKNKLPEIVTPKTPDHPFFFLKSQSSDITITQGLNHMEIPLIKAITESTEYTDEQERNYAIHCIRVGQITFSNPHDKNLPVMSPAILKGCRDLNKSQKKVKMFNKIENLLYTLSKDPKTREEAKALGGKARTFSQSGLGGEEKSDSKTIRTVSPPKPQ